MNVVMNVSDRYASCSGRGVPRHARRDRANETVQRAYLGELYGDFASVVKGSTPHGGQESVQ